MDAFADGLDLEALGFERAEPSVTGRPGYHPSVLLKIYIYGFLKRIQSSRHLERESQRNVKLIWLTGRLMPDFKTIADFRKDNRKAIRRVCREFVELCRELDLYSRTLVAIDGSKFKAVNSRDKNFTRKSVVRRIKKTASMQAKLTELNERAREVEEHPDRRVSLTDPDARSMMKPGGGSVVGYNVQTTVDSKHHLIAHHEVTNEPSDRRQLSGVARDARAVTVGKPEKDGPVTSQSFTVVADPGYYKSEEIADCYRNGIRALVPRVDTSGKSKRREFTLADFHYDSDEDVYHCPTGERAIYRCTSEQRGLKLRYYRTSACTRCALQPQCTTNDYRRIERWEDEHWLETAEAELRENPEAMRERKKLAEHLFGTIKDGMGSTHFLTKRLPNVKTEMSLHVLAWNMKRAISVLGVPAILEKLRAA